MSLDESRAAAKDLVVAFSLEPQQAPSTRSSSESRPLQVFTTCGCVRWTLVNQNGRPVVDGAGWHDEESGARQEALMALRLLLHTRLPGTDLEVSRYLAALAEEERAAVIDNAFTDPLLDGD